MKHGLSSTAVKRIADGLSSIIENFEPNAFSRDAQRGLETLELKARVNHIIAAMEKHLPAFKLVAPALCRLPQHWNKGEANDPLSGFAAWPIIDYVAVLGIHSPKLAFQTLEKLTPLFSAEFAIRPFIEKYPEQSFKQLKLWTLHKDDHVRRLASEGCRPRLPWGIQLKALVAAPGPILPILETLKNDPSLYVRKSVANNLNDISKDHPETVLDTLESWHTPASSKETLWIIQHASRTLIKQGNSRALALMGAKKALIKHEQLVCPISVVCGEALEFSLSLTSQQQQKLVIDYAIDFLRSNNQHNRKVFKLKTISAKKGEEVSVRKSYSFKAITTRRYYPGEHKLHIQVNGKIIASANFELI